MEAYSAFADVYDLFMNNIPYDEWAEYLCTLLSRYGVAEGIVLELGCGTGNITERLADKGYDMIGIDNSDEMLNVAMQKQAEQDRGILYLNQDMREFELYGTVAAIVSLCDSINYVTEYEDLVEVFRLANNYLDPEGVLIFDIKTYKYFSDIGDCTIAENDEEASYIWDNIFYEDEAVNEYELTIFAKEEDGRYVKSTEEHYQKAYLIEEIRKAIEEAGMKWVAAYEAFTDNEASEDCDRVYIIARECGKKERI